MILCKNCGAEYDDELDRCPYCGGDNFGKSVQVHEDTIHKLEGEKQKWEAMPDKVAKKGMSLTAKIVLAGIILVVLVCILVLIATTVSRKKSYQKEQENVKKMEAMYEAADYKGIYDYMEQIKDPYSYVYEKYKLIADMQTYVEGDFTQEDMTEYAISNNKPDALFHVKDLVKVLLKCNECEKDDYRYEEEEAVEYYRNYCYEYMEENYGIGSEKIETCLENMSSLTDENEDEMVETFQKLALEYLKEQN